eukprot:31561-Pelagococcus_subviridis.AAC.5
MVRAWQNVRSKARERRTNALRNGVHHARERGRIVWGAVSVSSHRRPAAATSRSASRIDRRARATEAGTRRAGRARRAAAAATSPRPRRARGGSRTGPRRARARSGGARPSTAS